MAVVIPESYAQNYKPIEITNIEPVEILPIIWQIKSGDSYYHIEHLRVAEATRIVDMMWQYGAGNHTAEEYQTFMNRLNTGMWGEHPSIYDNYTAIGIKPNDSQMPVEHANFEWWILNSLVKHANFIIPFGHSEDSVDSQGNSYFIIKYPAEYMLEYIKNHPNTINILWQSANSGAFTKEEFDKWPKEPWHQLEMELFNSSNYLHFVAGTNIDTEWDWFLKNKIYNGEYEGDEHGYYSEASMANSNRNSQPKSHLMVTIGTNSRGNIDQTDEYVESSKFPVWFADNVLFAWRAFPSMKSDWRVYADGGGKNHWKYSTSYPNYLNVAIASILFQMYAEVKDVDELLDMIRSSTDLRDYIRFDINGDGDTDDTYNGQPETQPLILMNPAGFFLKYLMPTDLPASIKNGETVGLSKGYYHGLAFDIPGAEVKINGEWISFSDENKDLIFAQNPFALEWRLNGDLIHKLGFKQGDTLEGRIIAVDDQWNGLNLSQDISIAVSTADAINAPKAEATSDTKQINLRGQRVGKGYKGIVISNGRKTIAK